MRKERIRATSAQWSPVDDLPSHSLAHGPQPRSIFMPQDTKARPGVLCNEFAPAVIVMDLHDDRCGLLLDRFGAFLSGRGNHRRHKRSDGIGNNGVWIVLAGWRRVSARFASLADLSR